MATKEYFTDCCDAPFIQPGWPDTDICSICLQSAQLLAVIDGNEDEEDED